MYNIITFEALKDFTVVHESKKYDCIHVFTAQYNKGDMITFKDTQYLMYTSLVNEGKLKRVKQLIQ